MNNKSEKITTNCSPEQLKNAKCRSNNSHLSASIMWLNDVRHYLTDGAFTMCNKARWSHINMATVVHMCYLTNMGFKLRTVKSYPNGASSPGLCPLAKRPVFYIKEWWYGGADGAGLSSLVLARVRPKGGADQLTLLLEQEQSKHPPVCYWSLCWPPTGNWARVGLSGKERHRKKRKKKKKKRAFGEKKKNSCAVVEVGIKSDAEQRGCFEETVGSGGEEDEVQTAVKMGGGEPVEAVLGLKAQVRLCCTTDWLSRRQSRAEEVILLKRWCS